ncbi:hypothetical protein [Deinococcus koreensis]|uniref:Uncharacterized protein n=1 Tax=Deinococcus koreensis TaxID=2054903 RepID=A0A2K3URK5_9DEIO|nr:hypothetical protein [Deinococcus koreensis]PNY79175.1 hypothetical protein CVO96_20455 [Deinococcus koreensis]
MSAEPKKSGRFGMLKGMKDAVPALEPAAHIPPPPAEPRKDDATQEPFSCTLSRGLKRRLKKASADEGRKQYLIVEQALAEYLARHHKNIE